MKAVFIIIWLYNLFLCKIDMNIKAENVCLALSLPFKLNLSP